MTKEFCDRCGKQVGYSIRKDNDWEILDVIKAVKNFPTIRVETKILEVLCERCHSDLTRAINEWYERGRK